MDGVVSVKVIHEKQLKVVLLPGKGTFQGCK